MSNYTSVVEESATFQMFANDKLIYSETMTAQGSGSWDNLTVANELAINAAMEVINTYFNQRRVEILQQNTAGNKFITLTTDPPVDTSWFTTWQTKLETSAGISVGSFTIRVCKNYHDEGLMRVYDQYQDDVIGYDTDTPAGPEYLTTCIKSAQ